MNQKHLTAIEIDQYIENELDAHARAELDTHIADCAVCHARIAREQKLAFALQILPRERTPTDLAARIRAAVDLRLTQDRQRRDRMPLVALATFFSLLLVVWFGLEVIIASQENGVLDFLSIFTSQSDLGFSSDSFFALIEAIPISELALALLSIITCIILAQQLVETIRPHPAQNKS